MHLDASNRVGTFLPLWPTNWLQKCVAELVCSQLLVALEVGLPSKPNGRRPDTCIRSETRRGRTMGYACFPAKVNGPSGGYANSSKTNINSECNGKILKEEPKKGIGEYHE